MGEEGSPEPEQEDLGGHWEEQRLAAWGAGKGLVQEGQGCIWASRESLWLEAGWGGAAVAARAGDRERSGLDQSVVLEGRAELAEGGACGTCGPRLWSGVGLC